MIAYIRNEDNIYKECNSKSKCIAKVAPLDAIHVIEDQDNGWSKVYTDSGESGYLKNINIGLDNLSDYPDGYVVENSCLFESNSKRSPVILGIPKRIEVKILSKGKKYTEVLFRNQVGWILSKNVRCLRKICDK